MKILLSITIAVLFFLNSISAQHYTPVTVTAGTMVSELFPPSERYQYRDFTQAKVFMKTGAVNSARLNYNLLTGEIEFINGSDTLMIVRKKDLYFITIEQDTFIYRNGYHQLIHSNPVKVYLKDKIVLKDVVKKGAMGAPNRVSAVENYSSVTLDANIQELIAPEDLIFQRTRELYILTQDNNLVEFRKKNIMELYPQYQDEIKKYLKASKVNFENLDDIIKFADFLAGFRCL